MLKQLCYVCVLFFCVCFLCCSFNWMKGHSLTTRLFLASLVQDNVEISNNLVRWRAYALLRRFRFGSMSSLFALTTASDLSAVNAQETAFMAQIAGERRGPKSKLAPRIFSMDSQLCPCVGDEPEVPDPCWFVLGLYALPGFENRLLMWCVVCGCGSGCECFCGCVGVSVCLCVGWLC